MKQKDDKRTNFLYSINVVLSIKKKNLNVAQKTEGTKNGFFFNNLYMAKSNLLALNAICFCITFFY
jgi:hypothetical protein